MIEIPEFMRTIGFWVKFVPIFFFFVIAPVWIWSVPLSFFTRVLFTLAGAIGVMLALNGKTIGKKHGFGGRR